MLSQHHGQIWHPNLSNLSLTAELLNSQARHSSTAVQLVLLTSRKQFAKSTYLPTWKHFSIWSAAQ
ncbi:hypothetical protein KIL84_023207, partial [Mauremys mutica]